MNVSIPQRQGDNGGHVLHMSGRMRKSTFRLHKGSGKENALSTAAYMRSPNAFGLRGVYHHIFSCDELRGDVGVVGFDDLMVDATLLYGCVRAAHVCSWLARCRVGWGREGATS